MRGISIKAILIGNIASVAITLLAVCAFFLSLIVFFVLVGSSNAARDVFAQSFTVIVVVSSTLGGGYVAGRIAQDRFVLHGILGSALWSLLLIAPIHFPHVSSGTAKLPEFLDFILSYGGPVFGMIGGYLAKLRTAQLAVLPIDERPSLKSSLLAIVRSALAAVTALIVYLVALRLLLVIDTSGFSFVFAVVAAVLAGTAVAPQKQRRLAGIILMVIAAVVPVATLVRRVGAGEAAHAQAFYVFLNFLGTGMAYLALLGSFPREFQLPSGRLWWLSTRDYAAWSLDERSVRMGLTLTGSLVAILLFVVIAKSLELAAIDVHYAVVIAGIVAFPLGVSCARPIYSRLYPDDLQRADRKASARLGLPV